MCKKIVVFLSVICLALIALTMLWYKEQHTFSEEQWKSDPDKRGKMVKSLLNEYDLIGMPENDIIALLGEEDRQQSSFKGDPNYYPPETTLVYFIGTDFMDGRWLIISLKNGLAERISFGIT